MKKKILLILILIITIISIIFNEGFKCDKIDENLIISEHYSAGFFSFCSIKLHCIINYINENQKLPIEVDSSNLFDIYKQNNNNEDITFVYFKNYKNINSPKYVKKIDYSQEYQYNVYNTLDYESICPIIKKYFTPSDNIVNIIQNIENKYLIDYKNTCVLFYRGNDKNTETKTSGYEEYVQYSNKILKKNPRCKFLIQSDETEFIEYFEKLYPNNSFYFKDEIRHMKKQMTTVDLVNKEQNFDYSQKYLAITIIMSKCEHVICGSGNCSIWIMFYRENTKNVYQYLNEKWHIL
jgi:hypothetical protein